MERNVITLKKVVFKIKCKKKKIACYHDNERHRSNEAPDKVVIHSQPASEAEKGVKCSSGPEQTLIQAHMDTHGHKHAPSHTHAPPSTHTRHVYTHACS